MKSIKQITTTFLTAAVISLFAFNCAAQEKKDPTSESDVIKETLKTIKEVEKLNQYIEQNKTLQKENQSLKAQIASLSKQIKELTKQITTSNDHIRKQLLSLPKFEVRSKIIGAGSAMAVLRFGDKDIRIRDQMEMSVPVENGIWTLMKVEKITKDVIELKFTELDRTITIFD